MWSFILAIPLSYVLRKMPCATYGADQCGTRIHTARSARSIRYMFRWVLEGLINTPGGHRAVDGTCKPC